MADITRPLVLSVAAIAFALLAACSDASDPTAEATPTTEATRAADGSNSDDPAAVVRARLTLIESFVADWRAAETIEQARAAAEAAANLIVGPGGPDYGDRDADGVVEGATTAGLLPALDGDPTGIANALATNECVVRDVLGGSWDNPAARWSTMRSVIEEWRPTRNTMPSLPSHPMRIVGWATLTLASTSLDEAHEFAGHAQLHVNVSLAALDC